MGQSGLERLAPVTTRIEMAGWRKNIKQDSSFKKTGKGLTGHHKGPCPLIVVTRRPFLSRLFIYFPDFVHLSKKKSPLSFTVLFSTSKKSRVVLVRFSFWPFYVSASLCVCVTAPCQKKWNTLVSLSLVLVYRSISSIFSRPAAFPPASRSPFLLVQLNTIHLSSRHIISNYFGALDAMNRVPSQSEIDGNVLTSWIHSNWLCYLTIIIYRIADSFHLDGLGQGRPSDGRRDPEYAPATGHLLARGYRP